MPEFYTTRTLREAGARPREIRLFLTFTAAMDRARDADRLWRNAAALFGSDPWIFDPEQVARRTTSELRAVLSAFGVSQRHGPDSAAWLRIAVSLLHEQSPLPVRRAVLDGEGDVRELVPAVRQAHWFPFLRGPKVSVMWVRMLAAPGGAAIRGLEQLPVAVDVQVRKVSEYLGVTRTRGADWPTARVVIQEAWKNAALSAVGPEPLDKTAAALDPALWFFGKWGCTFCERATRKLPISSACDACTLGAAVSSVTP
jgi:hypothetical protein